MTFSNPEGNAPPGSATMGVGTATVRSHQMFTGDARSIGHGPTVLAGDLAALGSGVVPDWHGPGVPEAPMCREGLPLCRTTKRTVVNEVLPIGNLTVAERARGVLPPPSVGAVGGINRIDKNSVHETSLRLGYFTKDSEGLDMTPAFPPSPNT